MHDSKHTCIHSLTIFLGRDSINFDVYTHMNWIICILIYAKVSLEEKYDCNMMSMTMKAYTRLCYDVLIRLL